MQAGFLIEVLPRESWLVFKELSVAVRVFVGQVGAEGVGVFPAPDNGVARVHNHSRGIEVISVDVMHLDRTGGGGFRDYGNRNIA